MNQTGQTGQMGQTGGAGGAGQAEAGRLLDELYAAGARIEEVDGVPRMRGNAVSEDLRARLKACRGAVLEELKRRRAAIRDRWGKVPGLDAGMQCLGLELPVEWQRILTRHVMRQPRTVHAWVMGRANDYFERGYKAGDCEWRACVDVVAWQRQTGGYEGAKFLAELDEVPGEKTENRKQKAEMENEQRRS